MFSEEIVDKNAHRRFVPYIASCPSQVHPEGRGLATRASGWVERVCFFLSDPVLPQVRFPDELVHVNADLRLIWCEAGRKQKINKAHG